MCGARTTLRFRKGGLNMSNGNEVSILILCKDRSCQFNEDGTCGADRIAIFRRDSNVTCYPGDEAGRILAKISEGKS